MKKFSAQEIFRILIALTLAFASQFVIRSSIGGIWDSFSLGALFAQRGKIAPPKEIVLVTVDDETFRKLRATSMFFPREKIAESLLRLKRFGAKGVVLDISYQSDWPDPTADLLLEHAIESMPVVLGARSDLLWIDDSDLTPRPIEPAIKTSFASKAFLVAHEEVDLQGMKFRETITTPKRSYYTLSQAAVMLLGRQIEKTPTKESYLSYYGGRDSFPSKSLNELLTGDEATLESFFGGKVVIIGYTRDSTSTVGARDKFPTPVAPDMPGVVIHATAAANILTGLWLEVDPILGDEITREVVVFLCSLLILSLPPLQALIILLIGIAATVFGTYSLFLNGIFLQGGFVVIGALFISWFISWTFGEVRMSKIQHAFAFMASRHMVKQLLKDPTKFEGLRRDTITSLYSDLEGFTRVFRDAPEEELATFVEYYYEALGEAVAAEQGFVVSYPGDAMLAIFGAPLPVDNSNERAIRAIVRAQESLDALIRDQKIPNVKTRFGIKRGIALVGIPRSGPRRNYTALGDSVNVAARIQEINKKLGTEVLIENGCVTNKNDPHILPVGTFVVRGRGGNVCLSTHMRQVVSVAQRELWLQALESFRGKEWEKSKSTFAQLSEAGNELRPLADYYIKQCEYYFENPPTSNWEGETH